MREVGLREAALLYGISEGTVRRRIKRKELTARLDDGRYRIAVPDDVAGAATATLDALRGELERERAENARLREELAAVRIRLDLMEERRQKEVDAAAEHLRLVLQAMRSTIGAG